MADPIEDEDDFSLYPGASSRLSSLFPSQRTEESNVNQSLIYVAPKQPKKGGDGQQQTGSAKAMKCFHAIAAYTYKLENGQYTTQGKLGVAIVGSKEACIYKLLLYKGKQQAVTTCTINHSFKFAVEQNNYAKFPDDKGEQWSITFNSETELISFTKQVAIAKVNSFGKTLTSVVVQDLVASDSDGASVDMGDALEISVTGWLYKDEGFGQVFDSSANDGKRVVIELGKSNVVEGWNEGLIGAKKGLRRLIIVPPSLGYDAKNLPQSVTPNDVLIFEVYIHKVKRHRDRSYSPSSKSRVEKKPEVPPRTHSVSNDDSIRSRGASLSEQLTQSPRKDNAQIISRMAKIGGTHLLGPCSTVVQTSSESEPEKEAEFEQPRPRKQSGASPKHALAQKKIEHDQSDIVQPQRRLSGPNTITTAVIPVTNTNSAPYVSSTHSSSETIQFMNQPYIHTHMPPAAVMPSLVPSLMDNSVSLLVSETRTQNSELRFTLSKISDKVDTVMQKVDDVRMNQGSFRMQAQVPHMEGIILAQNIERIVQENVQLKHDVEAKSSKIQELNEKICDILQRNQRFFEESNSFLEQRSDSMLSNSVHFQNQIQNLEQDKETLINAMISNKTKSCVSSEDEDFIMIRKKVSDMLGIYGVEDQFPGDVSIECNHLSLGNESKLETGQKNETAAAGVDSVTRLTEELRDSISQINNQKLQLKELQRVKLCLLGKLQDSEHKNVEQKELLESMNSRNHEQETLINSLTMVVEESRQKNEELNIILNQAKMQSFDTENIIQAHEMEMSRLSAELKDSISKTQDLQQQLQNLQEDRLHVQEKLQALEQKYIDQKELVESLTSKNKECEDLIESLQRTVEESKEQKEQLVSELEKAKNELLETKNVVQPLETKMAETSNQAQQEVIELRNELQRAMVFKKKYDTLHENALLLKNKYEQQVTDLMSELKTVKSKLSLTSPPPSSDFTAEIKRIMNALYKSLQNEFNVDRTYARSELLEMSLNVIMRTTLAIIERGQPQSKSPFTKENQIPEKENDVTGDVSSSMSCGDPPFGTKEEEKEVSKRSPSPAGDESSITEPETLNEPEPPSQTESICSSSVPQILSTEADSSVDHSTSSNVLNGMNEEMNSSVSEESPAVLDNVEESKAVVKPEKPKPIEEQEHLLHPNSDANNKIWRPQPSPPPLFDDVEEDEDDWLK